MKVTIDIKRMTSGKLLANRSGVDCMCVLGHIALACGVSPEALRDRNGYSQLSIEDQGKVPSGLQPIADLVGFHTTALASSLMTCNDDPRPFDDVSKQATLISFAARAGVELVFEGGDA